MKCNETLSKWCKNKHGASKIMDTLETYHGLLPFHHCGNVGDVVEVGEATGVTPAAFPLPFFTGIASVLCFMFLRRLLVRTLRGVYI
jgi:hypothetical protein